MSLLTNQVAVDNLPIYEFDTENEIPDSLKNVSGPGRRVTKHQGKTYVKILDPTEDEWGDIVKSVKSANGKKCKMIRVKDLKDIMAQESELSA